MLDIETMPDTHLLCRDLGHRWKPSMVARTNGHYTRKMICTRCHTKRKDTIYPSGEVRGRSYEYADGYLVQRNEPDEDLPSRVDYRRVAVHQLWQRYGQVTHEGGHVE